MAPRMCGGRHFHSAVLETLQCGLVVGFIHLKGEVMQGGLGHADAVTLRIVQGDRHRFMEEPNDLRVSTIAISDA